MISRGTDLVAMRIRDLAKGHDIPVLQSPMLARALYAHAELDQPIPATLYTAVAQVLAYVYRLQGSHARPGAHARRAGRTVRTARTRSTQQAFGPGQR